MPLDLDAIEATATNASSGEWGVLRDDVGVIEGDEETGPYISEVFATLPTGYVVNRKANAAFLVRARTDVLALLRALRERDAVIATALDALSEIDRAATECRSAFTKAAAIDGDVIATAVAARGSAYEHAATTLRAALVCDQMAVK